MRFLAVITAASLAQLVFSTAIRASHYAPDTLDHKERRADKLAGYYFVYFNGDTPAQEEVFSALSTGNDPLHWTPTLKNTPILTSTVGTKGLRDPSIIRGPDNSFYILCTDQQSTNWAHVQAFGSTSITVFHSTDLVKWTPVGGELHQVIGHNAGNAWAPSGFWDFQRNEYFIAFSSTIYNDASDPNHTAASYQRMMYTTTKDFKTFTAAKAYMDYGAKLATIDTDFLRGADGKTLYRFTKNESDRSASNTQGKSVFQEVSPSGSPYGPWHSVASGIGMPLFVEGPASFADNVTPGKYWLFLDNYNGGMGYTPFSSKSLGSGGWAKAAAGSYAMPVTTTRHGSILPIYQSEYTRIKAALIK